MSMHEPAARALRGCTVGAALAAGAALAGTAALAGSPASPRLGRPLEPTVAARFDLNVFPDGRGLPAGRGDAVQGRRLFDAQCAVCHGEGGRGASAEELAGGSEPLDSEWPDKTVGRYWPYATTVFDFVRRAKPMTAPGSLSADEVYALTAYLLWADGVIGERDEMNASTLPRVRMPNLDGFDGVDAKAR